MTSLREGADAARVIRTFIETYDGRDPDDRHVAQRIRIRLQREIYRREREFYSEFVDIGGEA